MHAPCTRIARALLTLHARCIAGWRRTVRVARCLQVSGSDLSGKRIAVMGLGNVGFPLVGYLLGKVGLDVAKLAPQGREAATFYFDGLFPFMVLLLVSYLTRPTDKARVDQFYGKMKTPVGDTPELEAAAMEETRRNPGRFDHTKLVRDSTWEFCQWDRVDTIGFLICCAVSGAIIGIFVLLLKWAA